MISSKVQKICFRFLSNTHFGTTHGSPLKSVLAQSFLLVEKHPPIGSGLYAHRVFLQPVFFSGSQKYHVLGSCLIGSTLSPPPALAGRFLLGFLDYIDILFD